MTERIPVLVDCDTGIDDAMALLFMLAQDRFEVVRITSVFGNNTAAQCAINSLRVLELVGRTDVPVAIRLADRRLAATVRQAFGFTHVRSTDELAAPWFVGAALGLEVLGTFFAGDVPLLYARVQVTPGGGLDGARLDALTGRSRVLSVRHRGEQEVHRVVRRWTTLEADDEAFVVGPHEELLALLRQDALPSDRSARADDRSRGNGAG